MLLVQQRCQSLHISEIDAEVDASEFEKHNERFQSVDQSVEGWFLRNSFAAAAPDYDRLDDKRISRISRTFSSLSAAWLRKSQQKAECIVRTAALKEKLQIEAAKLKIQQLDKEFNLKAELQVSEAKAKVIINLRQKAV